MGGQGRRLGICDTLSQIRKKNKSCSGIGQLFSAFWKWKQEDRYSRLTIALGQKRKTRDSVLKPQQTQNSVLEILLSGRELFFFLSTPSFIPSIQINPSWWPMPTSEEDEAGRSLQSYLKLYKSKFKASLGATGDSVSKRQQKKP